MVERNSNHRPGSANNGSLRVTFAPKGNLTELGVNGVADALEY
jgi:hypothetical protein